MILYYKEPTGDYLCIDTESKAYYEKIGQPEMREGRATAIAGQPTSMCTTGVSVNFLRISCKRVPKTRVPKEYLDRM